MINRHVIALNHLLLTEEQVAERKKNYPTLTNDDIREIMNFVRKYPENRINHDQLFTCGFSKN